MKYQSLKATIVFALVAALLLGTAAKIGPMRVEAASSSEIREQINELEAQKDELEAQMKELEGQMLENLTQIQQTVEQKRLIDQQIFLLHEQIANINEQIASYGVLIADKQDELDLARARYEELSDRNRERVRAMEEEGVLSYWAVIFKANSFSDLLDRINMVEEIAASDQRRLQELSDAAAQVEQAQRELEEERDNLELIRNDLDASQAELEAKQEESNRLLADLNAQGEEFEAMMEEGEDRQTALMLEIAKKEDEYDKAKYLEWLATYVPPTTKPSPTYNSGGGVGAPSASGWVCPVPYYTLTSPFGVRIHPIYKIERMHYGVDLSCATGTPIYAARSGQVTVASFEAGGAGYYVSINHGDGFRSIYMHMTHYIVSPGQNVAQGQVIGYVGSTGASTGPHLHFGISYNGSYVNPMGYIT